MTTVPTAPGADLQLAFSVQQFLFHEADLLDDRDYDQWLTLLHPDVRYVVPLARNVPRTATTEFTVEQHDLCWMDEGLDTITQRIRQIQTNIHWAEEPPSRVSHLVTNTRITDVAEGEQGRQVVARSRILVYQNRGEDEVNLFVGKRSDTLEEGPDGWRLLRRVVHLDQNVLLAKALTVFL
ncbi:3-phenylpropionate/cinnamic acid dioxygenase small subunit [Mycobacterium frederiksbergense]|uniref:3-phenylpropionate/cinnamic acid dioxygenase small subunit n=1 Tax=Mycolicibacterium frederiksbergense TaxID=117567 RepID=A0ABT6L6P8_9MYCO|nr:3-phenylpropionate/cinnamic acid dioxygenase subunit beta [Mycolicibacterium frederiksbergense]MDH6198573.1 3-phenylpropionate/cinnamic acid dioxygenase small subunit [Mycolicibacterium frederiksbergense]